MANLEFNNVDHIYKLDNKVIPSVTQLINPISKVVYQEISLQTLQAKARLGSKVHKLIERFLKFNYAKPDDVTESYFNNFKELWQALNDKHEIKILHTEFKSLYKDEFMTFAGTIDCILQVDNEIWLIDWKTVAKPTNLLLALQMYGYKKIVEKLNIKVDKVKAVQITNKSYDVLDLTKDVNSNRISKLFKMLYDFYVELELEGLINSKNKVNEEDF